MDRRAQQREATRDEIKRIARGLMAQHGTGGLALRAIARAMGITPGALYRYYPSLDDLITALILDAFNGLADAVAAADSGGSAGRRFYNVLMAYRQWALDHAADFELIYGTPIPGYDAPREVTVPAAARVNDTILGILADAQADGGLHLPGYYHTLPESIAASLGPAHTALLYLVAVGWARIHGMIMLELFHHTQGVVGDTEAFYRLEVAQFLRQFGLDVL